MWNEVARLLPLQGRELGQAMIALKALLSWNDGQPRLRVEVDKSLKGFRPWLLTGWMGGEKQ